MVISRLLIYRFCLSLSNLGAVQRRLLCRIYFATFSRGYSSAAFFRLVAPATTILTAEMIIAIPAHSLRVMVS